MDAQGSSEARDPGARDPAKAARPDGAWWRGGRAPTSRDGDLRQEAAWGEGGLVLPSRGGLGHRAPSGTGATGTRACTLAETWNQ